jgi:hypothetical protein
MKWIGNCLFACACLTCPLQALDSCSEDYTNNQKIELIKTEICYARYIAWHTYLGWIPHYDGLEWTMDILDLAEVHLEELQEDLGYDQ